MVLKGREEAGVVEVALLTLAYREGEVWRMSFAPPPPLTVLCNSPFVGFFKDLTKKDYFFFIDNHSPPLKAFSVRPCLPETINKLGGLWF